MIKLIRKYKQVTLIILLIFVNFLFIFGEALLPEEDEVATQLIAVRDDKVPTGQAGEEQERATVVPERVVTEVPVYVCGAVNRPGVYEVAMPGLIQHAIELAGGFTEQADPNVLNLAAPVMGNERIYVPQQGEVVSETLMMSTTVSVGETNKGKVNINTADQATLETLPGIGEAKAKQIMAYRQSCGTFKTIEALQDVSGIGNKTFEGLKDLITIE